MGVKSRCVYCFPLMIWPPELSGFPVQREKKYSFNIFGDKLMTLICRYESALLV